MSIQTAKIDLLQKILIINKPSVLEKINKILEKELVVGYTVEGKPLSKSAYNKRLKKAEEQIKAGNYFTQEDLEKESQNW